MEKVNVNGIELAYTRRGNGTPLVLLHGFPLDHHLWDETAAHLEGIFDLIMPDLRGFGGSTTVDTPYTMDDLASDIAGLLDQLGVEKAAIAGHSMGGYVALAFARLHPGRVSGLGLISSQVLADPPDRKEGRYKTAADVAEKGIGGVVDAMTTKFTSNPELQVFARKNMEGQSPAAFIGSLKAMAERHDSTPLLASIKYPVLVLHGDADQLIPVDRAREVRDAVPQTRYVELKGVGHIPMMEAVDETVEALKHLA
jgi:3-oxoadipate enol-lactonase